ncbi:MAG: metal-dependent hydrolase [Segniliparus sp.]|uniref:metal-dependent hydrolase n=1 Tax=Segniliparus sp. TaxID=2804064 RepID=UPI003F316976
MLKDRTATVETASSSDEFATHEIALRPRDVRFDFTKSPLHWIPGEPYASHFLTGFNLALPAGERWFCKVFTDALEYVKDERLREEILGFMGQEGVHAKSHDGAIAVYLGGHGIDVAPFLRQSDWLFGRLGSIIDQAEGPEGKRNAVIGEAVLVAAIEHFTAVLGDWVLNCRWDELGADPAMSDLWRWHGAEEVEHRHVAFNVAAYFRASYLKRIGLGLLASTVLYALFLRGLKFMVRQDQSLPNLGYPRLVWELHKAGKSGASPRIRTLLGSALRLFNPRYTPEKEGNTAQAVAYLATSPAARALHG